MYSRPKSFCAHCLIAAAIKRKSPSSDRLRVAFVASIRGDGVTDVFATAKEVSLTLIPDERDYLSHKAILLLFLAS